MCVSRLDAISFQNFKTVQLISSCDESQHGPPVSLIKHNTHRSHRLSPNWKKVIFWRLYLSRCVSPFHSTERIKWTFMLLWLEQKKNLRANKNWYMYCWCYFCRCYYDDYYYFNNRHTIWRADPNVYITGVILSSNGILCIRFIG